MASAGGGNIKVVVRVRPFNNRERDRNAECVVQMRDTQTVLTPPLSLDHKSKSTKAALEGTKTFAFDKSYWSFDSSDQHFAGQDDLFNDLGKPLLDNAFQGYNNCIFAYGQTGSGKSYSMMGYGQEAGVIPRICRSMFERIESLQADPNLACTVEVSYLEIYNERVRDLLNPSTKGNLKVREHPSTGPYVEDLAKLVVRSFQEIENLMDEGNKARTVAATNMNETSSRSHAVFTLTLTQKRHDIETSMDTEKVAKISLVDLAGSERATSTGATGARLKEGAEINRSLSTLGRVIAALADLSSGKKKSSSLVPYRDSVLTWLLKDSLGGNSLTAMIAAISPADINFEETLSTLRYADSAKRIRNHAVVNEDPNARMIRELKEELAQLRAKLSGGGGTNGGSLAVEQYSPGTPLDQQMVSIAQPDGTIKKVSKAEIVEQLNQSEKLYKDLNQTWEEKLQRTEQIHKEREAALEELGISIEKGFVGLSTPKKMPHLVNLSDDALLAECLVYNLKPGTTTVGNVNAASNAEIRLNGSQILDDHCSFENADGVVTVVPKGDASIMVNGIRVDKPTRLRSGFRVILGDFHIFRFNHPEEARMERAERGANSLRHSIAISQLGSPAYRPGHERSYSNISRAESEAECESSGANSPVPMSRNKSDYDWSYARREAVTANVAAGQKISSLSDDELDVLFEQMQRERAGRRLRPESRILEGDDDSESVASYPSREKYALNGTLDTLSVDTALTAPSTPTQGEDDEQVRLVREQLQPQPERQRESFDTKSKISQGPSVENNELRAEKERMAETLHTVQLDMERQLIQQRNEYERQIERLRQSSVPQLSKTARSLDPSELSPRELEKARTVARLWQRRRYVSLAETILQNTATLKEAQVMSQQMDKHVVFQFCVVDIGHTFPSSYDLVLNGVPGEDDDDLDVAPKPCIGVRVIDFKNSVVHLWSLQKLQSRLRQMRQMRQYLDRPQYLQHFRVENPFVEPCLPEYSRIGDADLPLTAVFESRVQDFSLEVVSPYTFSVVGIVKLALEPSSADAPMSTLKFNVVVYEVIGFPEREGTDVHAQLFIPGISEDGGATTTQVITGFDEGAIRFESVHSMSIPICSSPTTTLRVSIFAKATTMHLDKLLSWDDMRDSAQKPMTKRTDARLPETEFYNQEQHDMFAKVQIHEIGEDGDYRPVDVLQTSVLDPGVYQLHQGLQRRIVVELTHSSARSLQWEDVPSLRVTKIRLVDSSGNVPDLDAPQPEVPVTLLPPAKITDNADGTTDITLIGQWDSSIHNSLLLDRATPERYRVRATLVWNVTCGRVPNPVEFSMPLDLQVRSRSWIRPAWMLRQLWNPIRIVHTTVGLFSVSIRPTSAKRAADLWRMDTQHEYVRGEETLSGWTPRGVSLVKDYITYQKKIRRAKELEVARSRFDASTLTSPSSNAAGSDLSVEQRQLLEKILGLWRIGQDVGEAILVNENLEAPRHGAAFASNPSFANSPSIVTEVRSLPKNPNMLKGGYLMMPNGSNTRWVRRYVELRRPYLHMYTVPEGEELNAINLTNSRIDHQPQLARLLKRPSANVFAVFAPQNTFLFAARSERDKMEWILKIDQSYFSSRPGTPDEEV